MQGRYAQEYGEEEEEESTHSNPPRQNNGHTNTHNGFDGDFDEYHDDMEDVEMVGLMAGQNGQSSSSSAHKLGTRNRYDSGHSPAESCQQRCSRTLKFTCCMAVTLCATLLVCDLALDFNLLGGNGLANLSNTKADAVPSESSDGILFQCPADPKMHGWNDEDDPCNTVTYLGDDKQPFETHLDTGSDSKDEGKSANPASDNADVDADADADADGAAVDALLIDEAAFLSTFRDHKFDGWSQSYSDEKNVWRQFYVEHIIPHIESGYHIYESACGIGLKLFMTLEFIHEYSNATDITVYGNEYIDANAKRADQILDLLLSADDAFQVGSQDEGAGSVGDGAANAHKFRKGSVCTGDSTDLNFVPNEAFDMAFTGYISPLFDPLQLYKVANHSDDDYAAKREELCNPEEDDWKTKIILQLEAEKQEQWANMWATEMLRIVKPGSYVSIQSVALPICVAPNDWGGVSHEFWKEKGPNMYKWDVDDVKIVESKHTRYNVILHKKSQ
eukprot:CAMPEP_0198110632 /NCGR_PEP_ID=MMETSP1442-20131203/2659_1 /TAXON_ID= /ORGANISM="Craspedostauros australis, Strain CCMP3328" /LENGTH=502 /DNA_ID=CAMNT_0043766775 /DNA_START=294 /DNA_END=1802 /DNA_ORIENTATION=+